MSAFDAIVIGAGIVGCACARELAIAGLRTAVVEAGQPGAATTSAGMGHVVAMDDSPAQLALTVYSRSVWAEHAALFPAEVAYRAPGTLWVAVDDEEMAEVESRRRKYETAGVRADVLTPAQLAALEPNLRLHLAGALHVAGDGICDPPSVAAFYLADARRLGADVLLTRAVAVASGSVALADGTELHAPKIILATGTDCALLPSLPLRKRKGQLILTEPAPGFLRHQIVELGYLKSAHKVEADSIAFNVQPRRNGQVIIGASRQYRNEDSVPDAHILAALRARAALYMPALAALETASVRVGFRAATPDKLPIIGRTRDSGISLAVGFEGLGITCAPGAARLLADILLERTPAIDPTPYGPSRFSL